MKKTFSSRKSAFSLIELSIVLIIIGLLIAGITGGASLIKSSELRSVMSEARSYAVGVNAFYTQFDALPGDFATSISSSDVVGDGDEAIEHYTASTAEGAEAWRDLNTIGAIDDNLVYLEIDSSAVAAMTPGTHIPSSKIKSSGWAFDYDTNLEQNVVVLTGTTGSSNSTNSIVNGTTTATASITAADALSVDSKIDDGVATTGDVRGVNPGSTTCITSTAYTVGTSGKICALSYRVDVNS